MQNRNWIYDRAVLLELFVIINLSFLALDVFIAHSVNSFAHRAEWIPFIFSLVAPVLLLLTLFRGQGRMKRCVGHGVGWVSVFVGIGGLLFHLESQFFTDLTVKSLIYTAPFIAPLSYAGIGLLLIMHHTVRSGLDGMGQVDSGHDVRRVSRQLRPFTMRPRTEWIFQLGRVDSCMHKRNSLSASL